jgi:hypothetical protein
VSNHNLVSAPKPQTESNVIAESFDCELREAVADRFPILRRLILGYGGWDESGEDGLTLDKPLRSAIEQRSELPEALLVTLVPQSLTLQTRGDEGDGDRNRRG